MHNGWTLAKSAATCRGDSSLWVTEGNYYIAPRRFNAAVYLTVEFVYTRCPGNAGDTWSRRAPPTCHDPRTASEKLLLSVYSIIRRSVMDFIRPAASSAQCIVPKGDSPLAAARSAW